MYVMASGGLEGQGGGADRGRARPRKALDPQLAPEVTRWAEHVRQLIDGCFAQDADAARALKITPVTLSCYLSGRKEVPERAFVRRLHDALAQHGDRPVDPRLLQHTDELYMAALAVRQPLVWKVHTLTDQRDAALRREQMVRAQLRRMRLSLDTAQGDVTALRQDLRRAKQGKEALASQIEDLLERLRQAQEAAAEAVVAEAIGIAERAALALSARRLAALKASKVVLAACVALCVAGIAMAVVAPPLTASGAPWQVRGWATAGGAVLAGTGAGLWRQRQLGRLGVHWDWSAHLLATAFTVAIATVSLLVLAAGIRSQQDSLAHQARLSAAVSDCTESGSVAIDNDRENDPSTKVPTYECTYEWTINHRAYTQRASGRLELEGKHTTVLVDPTNPNTMVPEQIATYKILYIFAAVALMFLMYPGFMFWRRWEQVAQGVRRAVSTAQARAVISAKESASVR
ncbi:hypothetical protein [Streptomyces sp. NPDC007991]|uniref:hypothetical protein n=1 Tax=Streptomyces sp. NPDC007991 TaxID=3364803 RepID=UPI0036EB3F7E